MESNIIKKSIESVNNPNLHLIKNRNLLSLKSKLLYQLFDKDRPENKIIYKEYDHASRKFNAVGSKHKILMLVKVSNTSQYVKFGYPIRQDNQDCFVELSIDDLKAYTKEQLVLLYEGWLCFDGIDCALFNNTETQVMLYLPYKNIISNDLHIS